ncbi:Alpha-2B adrenergic receptor [Varanus komodoensis]|uniref:alpha-2B adrenergic receptor n=1 Tax=Varanus komodoensis TaxID=61221 RepID=UPI001CF77FE0|nr:alpha-2B adrenergic receptor [Varanus komodoensis]KAF7236724.1 Alpha-2B adrenergic receptor [Varanus komodoensis]
MAMTGNHGGYNVQATAAIAAVTTFLILFTIFGNVLVIIAVLTSRSLKAPQNLFLVSLAAADILVATLIIPFSLANELMGYWYFSRTWCKAYLALDVLFCTASIVHLCAISLDRYWSISRAIEYNSKRTPRRIKCTILIVWLIAAVISLPPLVLNEHPSDAQEDARRCELNEEPWYILSSSTCSFFAPCVIMILVYLRIYVIAKRRSRQAPRAKKPPAKAGEGASPTLIGPSTEPSPKQDQPQPLGEGDPNGLQIPLQEGGQPETQCLSTENFSLMTREATELASGVSPSQSLPEKKPSSGSSQLEGSPRGSIKQSNGPPQGSPQGMDTLATAKGEVLLVRRVKTLSANPWKKKAHLNREKRFTFVLAVVIGVFVICWFPFFFLYSLRAVCPPEYCPIPESTFKFFFWIGYCNSSLNPVIYTIFNQDFRKAFRKILCRQWTQTAW